MLRTVVLLHERAPHDAHLDWLLEPAPDAPLISFRLDVLPAQGPHHPAAGPYTAARLPDHRRRYLDYEGDIGQGRGTVRRLAAGTVQYHALTPDTIRFTATFPAAVHTWHARPQTRTHAHTWHLEPTDPTLPQPPRSIRGS